MPNQLFISYRRKSWGFTHRLEEKLREKLDAKLFIDYTGVNDSDFAHAILTELERSQAMLLVITEETFSDRIHNDADWVRREIKTALTLNLPIVLICVEGKLPPSGLPDDIKDIARKQGINFYPEYFTAAIDSLSQFVVKLGVCGLRSATTPPSAPISAPSHPTEPPSAPTPEKPITGRGTLDEALDLLDNGDPAKAKFLLEQVRDSGFKSARIDLTALIADAEAGVAEIERRRVAQIEYEDIALLFKRPRTQVQALQEFQKWQRDYADLWEAFDVQNFRARIAAPPPPPAPVRTPSDKLLPAPFAWIDIPAGKVTLIEADDEGLYLKKGQKYPFDVPAFQIAKYPLTNAQFKLFINADGYQQRRWWTDEGWEKRQSEGWTEPRLWTDETWNKDHYPVVGVSWFEVVAYCQWVSEVTGEGIRLPTEQEWQRAAQGDTNWAYPYGDKFDANKCNFNTQGTTPVTQYEGKGDSPFKIVDMSGNVYEWCVTDYETGHQNSNMNANKRVLRGGSWDSNSDGRLRVDFRVRVAPDDRDYDIGCRLARS